MIRSEIAAKMVKLGTNSQRKGETAKDCLGKEGGVKKTRYLNRKLYYTFRKF